MPSVLPASITIISYGLAIIWIKDFIKNNPYHETYPTIDPYDKVKESLLFNYDFSSI